MYRRNEIPGASRDARISISFQNVSTTPGIPLSVAVLIYNYLDLKKIEDPVSHDLVPCSAALSDLRCTEKDYGRFVIPKEESLISGVLNENRLFEVGENLEHDKVVFTVNVTGLYCVIVIPVDGDIGAAFTAKLEYLNPYGYLRGSDYPILPLSGFLSITYLLIGIMWLVKSFMYWKDLLPLQNYCTGVIFFLMVEMAFNYGFYEDYNRRGTYSNFLLVMTVLLNAGRNSVSYFMLLIVSLGFGVVKPTLGPTMKNCLALTYVHFAAGVLYTAGSRVAEELTGLLVLMFILPLSITVTIFYMWILNGLKDTIEKLKVRRQAVKLTMYH
ncbi:hypothetical protein HK096_008624, partial [Nowakowskiella sp. JEL0078]